jgi:hypothetical protein
VHGDELDAIVAGRAQVSFILLPLIRYAFLAELAPAGWAMHFVPWSVQMTACCLSMLCRLVFPLSLASKKEQTVAGVEDHKIGMARVLANGDVIPAQVVTFWLFLQALSESLFA